MHWQVSPDDSSEGAGQDNDPKAAQKHHSRWLSRWLHKGGSQRKGSSKPKEMPESGVSTKSGSPDAKPPPKDATQKDLQQGQRRQDVPAPSGDAALTILVSFH
jgi:hypothetical protein